MDEIKMPKKIMIIGNGFDLAMKAKTKYEDFYNCLKTCMEAKTLEAFEDEFFRNNKNSKALVDTFFDIAKDNRENYFIEYFLNYKKIFGDWVSFEQELTRIVKAFDDLIFRLNSNETMSPIMSSDGSRSAAVKVKDNRDLWQVLKVNQDNKYFKCVFSYNPTGDPFYFKHKKDRNDCELYRTEYEVYKAVERFSESFPKELFKDLTVFSALFSLYLEIVEHFVNYDRIVKDAYDCDIIINYNYTNYLDRLLKNNYLSRTVLYINGSLENVQGEPKDKIVFGIDSDTELSNTQFKLFTKRIQRSIKETDVSRLNSVLGDHIEEIIVIGHSLDIADYESLGFIFSKCEGDGLKPQITVYYYDLEARMNLTINLEAILGSKKFDEYQRGDKLRFIPSEKAWIKADNR